MPYLIIFVLGAMIGAVCRGGHLREATEKVQRDTVVRYDTVRYSRLELVRNPYELPRSVKTQYVYIPDTSVEYIYRDSIRYVTVPREYYHTRTDEAEIWHSGIDSTIDSLQVFARTVEVTERTVPQMKRNSLSVGVDAVYLGGVYTPVYMEYERLLKPWLSVYGQVAYDLPSSTWGVGVGIRMQVEW